MVKRLNNFRESVGYFSAIIQSEAPLSNNWRVSYLNIWDPLESQLQLRSNPLGSGIALPRCGRT